MPDNSSASPSASDIAEDAIACSVLVPVLNEERHIAATLRAMRDLRAPGRLEFLLIDGGSSDRTREIISEAESQDPRFRLYQNPRGTIPSGLNVGLSQARGRWVARMDAHSEYPADYLKGGVQRLCRGDTRWVSGPQIPVGEGTIGRSTALALRTRLGRGQSRRWTTDNDADEYELDTGVFCGVWARETLLEYGGWDEQWDRNEDSELAGRFLSRDEVLVCLPRMAAVYRPRESLVGLWSQYYGNGRFRVQTASRHPHTLRRSALLLPGLPLAGLLAVLAPEPLRLAMRLTLGLYGLILAGAGIGALPSAERRADALLVPPTLAVMHVAFGVGFIRGVLRTGLPLRAAAIAAGFRRLNRIGGVAPYTVYAPSLSG